MVILDSNGDRCEPRERRADDANAAAAPAKGVARAEPRSESPSSRRLFELELGGAERQKAAVTHNRKPSGASPAEPHHRRRGYGLTQKNGRNINMQPRLSHTCLARAPRAGGE